MTYTLKHDEQFIHKLYEIIEENISRDNLKVRDFASLLGMSESALNHKLHNLLNTSINQLIREIRLKDALKLLESENLTVSEVTFKVGFRSPTYFVKCFHDYYGYPPGKIANNLIARSHQGLIIRFYLAINSKVTRRIKTILKIHLVFLLIIIVYAIVHFLFPLMKKLF